MMKRFSRITTTQIARICGVSQGTVDRALHNRGGIRPETREKILAVAREYDYVPQVRGGAANDRSMLIGVVLFDLYNEFFSKLAMSLVNRAKAFGYSVIFLFSDKDLQSERSAVDYFNFIGVDGIVLFSVGSDDESYIRYLHSLTKPLVLIGNRISDLTYIGIDDYRAMYDLTCRMLSEIRTGEIVYFAPILKKELHRTNAQLLRVQGFLQAVTDHRRMHRIAYDEAELAGDAAGIICATDYYVLKALRKLGSGWNKSIAGFDNISLLKDIGWNIRTVEYSTDRIAAACIHYILGRKYEKVIPYSIVFSQTEPPAGAR